MESSGTDAIREVVLTQGFVAIIDEADWPLVSQFKWHAAKSSYGDYYYAAACIARSRAEAIGCKKHFKLHQLLMGFPGLLIDHRDGNRMNNRRSNLRVATIAQNSRNSSKPRVPCSSRFKGVSWHRKHQVWQVFIQVNRKNKFLGHFKDEEEAGRVYDIAARFHYGQFARLNFPVEVTT